MKRTSSILSSNGATESTDLQQSLQIEDMPLTVLLVSVYIHVFIICFCVHITYIVFGYVMVALVVRRIVIIVSSLVYI